MKTLGLVCRNLFMLLCSFFFALSTGYIFADLCSGKNEPIQVLLMVTLLVFLFILSIILMLAVAILED
jgi:ABC-type polysaccharide/polyol phosphate export permease